MAEGSDLEGRREGAGVNPFFFREYLNRWWYHELAVPTAPARKPLDVPLDQLARLADLTGRAKGGRCFVVTSRGVPLPVHLAHRDWTVKALSTLLRQIEELPEVTGPRGFVW